MKTLPGMREFYPAEMRQLNYVFKVWRKSAEKYGYEEIEGPILEDAKLWEKKGEISEQMYTFEDKGGRKNALRPEFTPSLARMTAAKQKALTKPLRWYSINRCWRYERPQKGRAREFFQLNVDCLGLDSMKADAEVITIAIEILKQLGIKPEEAYVRINNRKLLKGLITGVGIDETITKEVSKAIDKKEKLSEKEFENLLQESGLTKEQAFGLKDILNIDAIEELEKIEKNKEAEEGYQELKELFSYLGMYGVKEYCQLDTTIVRGLDYYTSTVFEIFDKKGELRALAGGGRYDDLVGDFTKEKCPGIGFGMGELTLQIFLEENKKLPPLKKELEYYIAPLSENVLKEATQIAQKLRTKNNVELDLKGKNLKKQLEAANNSNAKKIIIVGEKDLKEGKVTIRDLESGEEKKVKINSL